MSLLSGCGRCVVLGSVSKPRPPLPPLAPIIKCCPSGSPSRRLASSCSIWAYQLPYSLSALTLARVSHHCAPRPGSTIGAAFLALPSVPGSPLYVYPLGLTLTLLFVFFLGAGATVSEPSIAIMGATVQRLSQGAFPKLLLFATCCAGIGAGAAVGAVKIVYQWPLVWLLLGCYVLGKSIASFAASLPLSLRDVD